MACSWCRSLLVPAVAFAVGLAAAVSPARAHDTARGTRPTRPEGRYFVELAEVMITPHDFDMALGTRQDSRGPLERIVAELEGEMEAPALTFGLERPSGRTRLSFSLLDFDRKAARMPRSFDVDDQAVTTAVMSAGVVFRRQPNLPTHERSDDFIPNHPTEMAHVRRVDFTTSSFQVRHDVVSSERARLRWIAGIRHAQVVDRLWLRLGFARESTPQEDRTIQDFFRVVSQVETHGIGPEVGLDGRLLLGARSRWSLEADGVVALLPESTSVRHELTMVDATWDRDSTFISPFPVEGPVFESPIVPGIAEATTPFRAVVRQSDFTDATFLFQGRASARVALSESLSIGVECWHARWTNLLSLDGVLDTIARQARYEQVRGDARSNDPELQDTESVIHVPRFEQRHAARYDGIGVNLRYGF